MTSFDRFEQRLPDLMTDLAAARVPDYFDDLLQQAARTRQRPAWSSLERWLPMRVTALSPVSNRARSLAGLAILALVGLLVAAGLFAYVGSQPQRLPAPFGPAGNGLMYYSSGDGDIYSVDPATAKPRAIVTGPAADAWPLPSRNGQEIEFTRTVTGGDQVVIADQDGSNVRPLPGTFVSFGESDWSPDDRSLAFISTVGGLPSLSILAIDGSGTRTLPLGMEIQNFWYLPDGRLIFHGTKTATDGTTYGLYVVNEDGTGLRPILPPTSGETDWLDVHPSPDGLSLVYHRWRDPGELGRLHVVDIATGQDRPVAIDGTTDAENHEGAQFSPDGSHLLFARYKAEGDTLAVVPVGGGAALAIGPTFPDSQTPANFYAPDGKTILAYYPEIKELWLLDPTGQSQGQKLSLPVSDLPTWQRVAP